MDRTEWEALYRSAVPRVYRALLATLRNPQAAEDALHDAFAEGLRRPPSRSENIAGWLYRVALRGAHRQRWRFLRLERAPQTAEPVDDIAATLDRMKAGRLLALLSERQRARVSARVSCAQALYLQPRPSYSCLA